MTLKKLARKIDEWLKEGDYQKIIRAGDGR